MAVPAAMHEVERSRWVRWSSGLRKRARPAVRIVLWIGGVLLVCRIVAPFAIEAAINHRLARIPDYSGRVEDVDLGLWRGAYALEKVDVRKQSGEIGAPFFSAARIDFSIAWRELLRGRIVSDIVVEQAKLTFVRGATEDRSQLETDRRWQDVVEDIFPIEITRLEVKHGDVQFVDQTRKPHVDVSVHNVELVATGLRNRRSTTSDDELPAALNLRGTTVGDGQLGLDMRLAPLARQPLFDLDLRVEQVSLPALNTFLRAYANVDVSHGYFDLFLEIASREGAFRGYVKPFFRDLHFENITDRDRPVLSRMWESIVNFLDNVLKNPDSQQLGTRVPFSGEYGETEVGMFTGIVNAVRYGFGAAFSEALEGRIQPSDVAPADGGKPDADVDRKE